MSSPTENHGSAAADGVSPAVGEKTPAASATDNAATPKTTAVTQEELVELIQAILFANAEEGISQRAVYREITEKLSAKPGFEYLRDVKEGDVRKALKLAKQKQQPKQQQGSSNAKNKDLLDLIPNKDKPLQVFTVGDGSILQLAEEVKAAAISSAAEQAASKMTKEGGDETTNFVHVFLDVSADQSGQKPHQALINFQFLNNGSSSGGKKKKGGGKNKATPSGNGNTGNHPDQVIVKIQRALPQEGETTQHPMLLYDQSRKWKTFIHPEENTPASSTTEAAPADSKSNDNAYQVINDMIAREGTQGALGNMGGTKSYFYAIVSKKNRIISINVSKLAPSQDW